MGIYGDECDDHGEDNGNLIKSQVKQMENVLPISLSSEESNEDSASVKLK